MFAASGLAWIILIALFGTAGAVLAIWPAVLIGAGGVLATAQLALLASLAFRPAAVAQEGKTLARGLACPQP